MSIESRLYGVLVACPSEYLGAFDKAKEKNLSGTNLS